MLPEATRPAAVYEDRRPALPEGPEAVYEDRRERPCVVSVTATNGTTWTSADNQGLVVLDSEDDISQYRGDYHIIRDVSISDLFVSPFGQIVIHRNREPLIQIFGRDFTLERTVELPENKIRNIAFSANTAYVCQNTINNHLRMARYSLPNWEYIGEENYPYLHFYGVDRKERLYFLWNPFMGEKTPIIVDGAIVRRMDNWSHFVWNDEFILVISHDDNITVYDVENLAVLDRATVGIPNNDLPIAILNNGLVFVKGWETIDIKVLKTGELLGQITESFADDILNPGVTENTLVYSDNNGSCFVIWDWKFTGEMRKARARRAASQIVNRSYHALYRPEGQGYLATKTHFEGMQRAQIQ